MRALRVTPRDAVRVATELPQHGHSSEELCRVYARRHLYDQLPGELKLKLYPL